MEDKTESGAGMNEEKPKQERCARWWSFWDMYSGGHLKTEWHQIFIEAENESDACDIFTTKTGRVLDEATEFHRVDETTAEYCEHDDVLVIRLEARP